MQDGLIVEQSDDGSFVQGTAAPVYASHLLAAQPRPKVDWRPLGAEIIRAKNLKVWFPIKAGVFRHVVDHVKAVDGVSVDVRQGETVGIVGESGSGKTTLALGLLRLVQSEGPIVFMGRNIEAPEAQRAASDPARDADRVPGSLRLACRRASAWARSSARGSTSTT